MCVNLPYEVLEVGASAPAKSAAPLLLESYQRGYRLHSFQARGDNLVFTMEHQSARSPLGSPSRGLTRKLPRPVDNREMLAVLATV